MNLGLAETVVNLVALRFMMHLSDDKELIFNISMQRLNYPHAYKE